MCLTLPHLPVPKTEPCAPVPGGGFRVCAIVPVFLCVPFPPLLCWTYLSILFIPKDGFQHSNCISWLSYPLPQRVPILDVPTRLQKTLASV